MRNLIFNAQFIQSEKRRISGEQFLSSQVDVDLSDSVNRKNEIQEVNDYCAQRNKFVGDKVDIS